MLSHYLTWTWRTLRANRFTTAINLLALVLGLLSFVLAAASTLFLRSNDVDLPKSDRIYVVTEQIVDGDGGSRAGPMPLTSPPVAKYLVADYPEIEAVTRLKSSPPIETISAGQSRSLRALFFDETFSKVFQLPLRFGDPATAFSTPKSAVLTLETAHMMFGERDPVGQTLRFGPLDVTVTGVLERMRQPSHFAATKSSSLDLLISRDVRDVVAPDPPEPESWDRLSGNTYVLLPKGQSADDFDSKLSSFGDRHVQRLHRRYLFSLVPLPRTQEAYLNGLLRSDKTGISIGMLLLGMGTLVLAVASLNYANLAAAQAVGRLAESGMRKMLGAGRGELLAQYLIEGLILTLGALLLVLLAVIGAAGPLARSTGIDIAVLFPEPSFWFLLVVGVAVITVMGGLYPALTLSGSQALTAAIGGKTRPARSRLASCLVGGQFLAASFLLVMVGVVLIQDVRLRLSIAPDDGSSLLVIETRTDKLGLAVKDIRNAMHDIPGIQAVSGADDAPWSFASGESSYYDSASANGRRVAAAETEIDEDYLATNGIHLLAGRELAANRGGDIQSAEISTYNLMIDRAFAAAFGWTPEQAVGKRIFYKTLSGGSGAAQIVGVVETRPQHLLRLGSAGATYRLMPDRATVPMIRLSNARQNETVAAIDQALLHLAPQIQWRHSFSSDLFASGASLLVTVMSVLSGLALFAVIIAMLSLAGMATYTITGRTEEIGIRKILGADDASILRLLLWDLSRPVLIATAIAWPFGYVAAQAYLTLFTERTPLGVAPFALSLILIMIVAWLSVGWKLMGASRRSPAEILRHE